MRNCLLCCWTDCFWGTQTSSVRGFFGWSPEGWGSCLQKDTSESRRCAREGCAYKLLGMATLVCCRFVHSEYGFFVLCDSKALYMFQGMDFTTDKLRSLVRKWQTLIEAHVDVKTTDNYTLRMFCIAFTKRRANQVKRTCYAQSSQIRQVCFSDEFFISC